MSIAQSLAFLVAAGTSYRSALSPAVSESAGSAMGGAVSLLAYPFRAASKLIANRRDFSLLSEMEDHQLRDIGLVRSDIDNLSGLSIADRPFGELSRRSQERRGEAVHKTN